MSTYYIDTSVSDIPLLHIAIEYNNQKDIYRINYPDIIDLIIRIYGSINIIRLILIIMCTYFNQSFYLSIMYKQLFKLSVNYTPWNFFNIKSFENIIGES